VLNCALCEAGDHAVDRVQSLRKHMKWHKDAFFPFSQAILHLLLQSRQRRHIMGARR